MSVGDSVSSETSYVGLRLLNRYQLDEPIASGALCSVYRGQDVVLRRSIVAKAVAPQWADAYRAALRHAAALSHPAVVATYDALEYDAWLFIIQEYVTARPLTAYVRDGVPSERATDLGGQIVRALAYAHAHDITHGDLTPAAVLVDRQATVRINNFGLPPDEAYFDTCAVEWDAAHDVAARSEGSPVTADIASVGFLLWMLLSELKHPAQDDADTTAMRREFRPDVPESLRDLVRRCVRQSEPGAITDTEALFHEMEELSSVLAKARPTLSEQTPPSLRVARAAIERDAAWSADATLGSIRPWGPIRVSTPVSESAPTVPQSTESAPWLSSVVTPAIAPRLRLPSHPVPESNRRGYQPDPEAQRQTAMEQTPPETTLPDAPQRRQIGLWVVIAIGVALFILFFLIGYYMPYRLGGG